MPRRVSRATLVGGALALIVALLACKQGGGAGSRCEGDGDCKNGFLCESSVCLDAEKVKQLRGETNPGAPLANAAPPLSAPPPPAAAPQGPRLAAGFEGIGERSTPPTLAEWDAVPREITVAHSTPLRCETKFLREWLRVSCRGKEVQTIAVQQRDGVVSGEVMTYAKAGQVTSLVMPIRGSLLVKVAFGWSWGTRTLSVKYDRGAPQPEIAFDAPPPG